jgi:FkbM family methyltransferase
MNFIKKLISRFFLTFGYSIEPSIESGETRRIAEEASLKLALFEIIESSGHSSRISLRESLNLVSASKSQLGQDIFALSYLGFRREGFFVEFGAANGKDLSNSYLLEKNFDWTGILSEPARVWHTELKKYRTCSVDYRCVYSNSGSLVQFSQTDIGELSTISSFIDTDSHSDLRQTHTSYAVETITLADLLNSYGAPSHIDFLSIDTEGSEFEILGNFDFEKYSFGAICVEHNFTDNRERIFNLLSSKGYKRVLENFSKFDDWYLGPETVSREGI